MTFTADSVLPDRRQTLAGLVAVVTAGLRPSHSLAAVLEPKLPDSMQSLFDALCDTILPETDTPGAMAAGVPAYVLKVVADAGGPSAMADFRAMLARLGGALDATTSIPFAKATPAQRFSSLSHFDTEMMQGHKDCRPGHGIVPKPGSPNEAYLLLKALIVLAYFTSEAGGGHHLRFELVPGHYTPDTALAPDWINYSNETILGQ